jgi:hypothetical protein
VLVCVQLVIRSYSCFLFFFPPKKMSSFRKRVAPDFKKDVLAQYHDLLGDDEDDEIVDEEAEAVEAEVGKKVLFVFVVSLLMWCSKRA